MASEPGRTIERLLGAAFDAALSGLVAADPDGRIVLVNPEAERLFGYGRDELLGRTIEVLLPPRPAAHGTPDLSAWPERRSGGPRGASGERRGRRKDGTEIPVAVAVDRVRTDDGDLHVWSILDLGPRVAAGEAIHRLERELRQAQKLESVGVLAGGIAHDFNNILAGILGYAELARARAPDASTSAGLGEIIAAAGRGRDLVAAILRFSRRQRSDRRPTDLMQVVNESLNLLRPSLPLSITVETRNDLGPAHVLANPTAVEQVVLNLATNAAHAMKAGGTIEIALLGFDAGDEWVHAHPGTRAGAHVVLQVRDSGTGMSPEVRARAIEPFFTTKAAGEGSGLGLAMVHDILRDHGGAIEIGSEVGHGTTVRCLFPALAVGTTAAPAEHGALPAGRGERVLYLDDEASLSRLGQLQLTELGYRVTSAMDPDRAIDLLRDGTFELLITDYSMPRMDGLELGRRLRAAGQDLPILLLSGVTHEFPVDQLGRAGIDVILAKPVSFHDLATAVRTVLDGAAERRARS